MPKKTFTPEQIVAKLRQIKVLISQGKGFTASKMTGHLAQEISSEPLLHDIL